MNANELADLLDFDAKTLNWKAFADAATMLRQQQAEIEALKNPILRAISMAFNPLTDEEITEIFDTTFEVHDYQDSFIKFARAILRKAQEK